MFLVTIDGKVLDLLCKGGGGGYQMFKIYFSAFNQGRCFMFNVNVNHICYLPYRLFLFVFFVVICLVTSPPFLFCILTLERNTKLWGGGKWIVKCSALLIILESLIVIFKTIRFVGLSEKREDNGRKLSDHSLSSFFLCLWIPELAGVVCFLLSSSSLVLWSIWVEKQNKHKWDTMDRKNHCSSQPYHNCHIVIRPTPFYIREQSHWLPRQPLMSLNMHPMGHYDIPASLDRVLCISLYRYVIPQLKIKCLIGIGLCPRSY